MGFHTDQPPLDIEYAAQMRCHPYGIALYHPQPRATFHPGMVGYFDAYGNWNHITDLSQVRSSADTALAPPADLPALAQPEQQTWGPKLGSSTRGRRVELSAGISETVLAAAGAPLSLGSCFRFESERASGAVLVTSDPVVHERFYHESPFKRWVVSNARRLLGEREELKEYELWVVTSTWSAREAAVNCWRDQKKAVEVGFKVGFVEIGEVAPKGDWVDRGAAEGWIRVKGDEEDRRVVFFGGLRFRYRPLIGGLSQQTKRNKFRGDEPEQEVKVGSIQADDGMQYELLYDEILERRDLRPAEEEAEQEGDIEETLDQSDDDW